MIGSTCVTPLRFTAGAMAQVCRALPGRNVRGSVPYSGVLLTQPNRLSSKSAVRLWVMLRIMSLILEQSRLKGGMGGVFLNYLPMQPIFRHGLPGGSEVVAVALLDPSTWTDQIFSCPPRSLMK